jgi:hypothetical protein
VTSPIHPLSISVCWSPEAEQELSDLSGQLQARLIIELQWAGLQHLGQEAGGRLHAAGLCLEHRWKGQELWVESMSPCCLCHKD